MRIVDSRDEVLARGQVGEIVVRGDNVMRGYWNKPTETAAALRNGRMHNGDLGYMDERGYAYVVDRLKDMIITGGENVYSAEVENALAKHPAVAACAVIGVEDAQWGEWVHAFVVLQPETDATSEELQAFCRTLISNYKLPRSVDLRRRVTAVRRGQDPQTGTETATSTLRRTRVTDPSARPSRAQAVLVGGLLSVYRRAVDTPCCR